MVECSIFLVILALIFGGSIPKAASGGVAKKQDRVYVKLTNLRCECVDSSFCKIELCRLRIMGPGQANAFLNATLLQRPVTNCLLNIDLYRKTTMRFHPFPVNITFDGCKFMQNTAKIPFMKFIFNDVLKNRTNFNHPCPYNDDYVYIMNAGPVRNPYFDFIPEGDYLIKIRFIVDGDLKAIGHLYTEFRNPWNTFLS